MPVETYCETGIYYFEEAQCLWKHALQKWDMECESQAHASTWHEHNARQNMSWQHWDVQY